MVIGLAPHSINFSTVNWAALPAPETMQVFPSIVSLRVLSISCAKYTAPYPVASSRMREPPQLSLLPVNTPVNSFARRLYWPKRYPISRPPTPMSPAGTSVLAPTWRNSSVMNDWQKRMTLVSVFPLGSKSAPPLPPPIGRPVSEFLKTCSNARNLMMLAQTVGWKHKPPLNG